MATAMRAPRRRRSDRVDGQHVPPVGGGVEQGSLDDLDFISRLPDEVLGTVVSLLPTKDGARTQVLSRRWRPLWRSPMAPLNLAADDNLSGDNKRAAVVSKILSDHPGPTRHFSLRLISLGRFRVKVARWFCSETLTGLEELQVTNCQKTCYPLPPWTLTRFAPTLRLLMLSSCLFPDGLPSFPHLKQLILCYVGISDDSLRCMISGCAALENLELRKVRFGRLCINSQTLRSINLQAHPSKGELVIEDAPCLERLLPDFPQDGPATIRVTRAPKLEILGFLSEGIFTFHLGTNVFQKMIGVSLTTKMHAMKILALDSTGANLYAVVDFLKCFPCLEKLYVVLESLPKKDINVWLNYDPLDPIECLELHLQKVVLRNYEGNRRSFIDFAKFLILNAKVLKEMEIGVLNVESDQWMSYQRSKLQLDNRASRDAQIELRSDRYASPANHVCTHDFSIADPFEPKAPWHTHLGPCMDV